MEPWIIPIVILLSIAFLIFILMLVLFFMIFYSPRASKKIEEEFPIPDGEIYEAHREQMVQWIKDARAMAHTDVSIVSFDGLKLCGQYFEYEKGAPIEILFHGYKGTAERDLSGGVYRCFKLGHSALIVDHRASGKSEGRVITFGAKESRDCLSWVDFVINSIDKNAKIILTGISMGAATVMMASSMKLPSNVIGVLADCGYTSTKDIIKKVIGDMKLPAGLIYPFVRLSAILFGGFDPNLRSPEKSMQECRLPIIFFHGDVDDYVPYQMSEKNYEACISESKRLVITPKAGHGLCFPVDMDAYLAELDSFFAPYV